MAASSSNASRTEASCASPPSCSRTPSSCAHSHSDNSSYHCLHCWSFSRPPSSMDAQTREQLAQLESAVTQFYSAAADPAVKRQIGSRSSWFHLARLTLPAPLSGSSRLCPRYLYHRTSLSFPPMCSRTLRADAALASLKSQPQSYLVAQQCLVYLQNPFVHFFAVRLHFSANWRRSQKQPASRFLGLQ